MTMTRSTKAGMILTVFVGAALLLAGCAGGAAAPSATPTPSATATAAPTSTTPSASPTSAVPASIPQSCDAVGTAASRADTVATMRMQSDGKSFIRPVPNDATLALGCDWISGDTTGILLLISTASPDNVAAAVAGLPAKGFSCQTSDDFGAAYCTMPGTGANSEDTVVARDNVWIYMESHNVNARALLSDLASQVFH